MVKLHCDNCDTVIDNFDPRIRVKSYPCGAAQEERNVNKPEVDIVVCEKCARETALIKLVSKFKRTKF